MIPHLKHLVVIFLPYFFALSDISYSHNCERKRKRKIVNVNENEIVNGGKRKCIKQKKYLV